MNSANPNLPSARLLSAKESAAMLGISIASFWRRCGDGLISKPVKIGKRSLWPETEISALIDRLIEERDAA